MTHAKAHHAALTFSSLFAKKRILPFEKFVICDLRSLKHLACELHRKILKLVWTSGIAIACKDCDAESMLSLMMRCSFSAVLFI